MLQAAASRRGYPDAAASPVMLMWLSAATRLLAPTQARQRGATSEGTPGAALTRRWPQDITTAGIELRQCSAISPSPGEKPSPAPKG